MSISGLVISPLPEWTATYRPAVAPGESYQAFLERSIDQLDAQMKGGLLQGADLARYFGHDELVVPSYRGKRRPPPELWPGLVFPLALALLLRQTQVCLGHGPLLVVATYRPEGGAPRSKHKINAAIDLRPVNQTRAAATALMVGAAWIWRTHEHLQVGVGTYGSRMDRTGLVHLDACARPSRQTWRYDGDDHLEPAIPHQPPAPWET